MPCTLKDEAKQSSSRSRYADFKCAAFAGLGDSAAYESLKSKVKALEDEPGQTFSEYDTLIKAIDAIKESDYISSMKSYGCFMFEMYDMLRNDVNRIENDNSRNGGTDDILGEPRTTLLSGLDSKMSIYNSMCRSGGVNGSASAARSTSVAPTASIAPSASVAPSASATPSASVAPSVSVAPTASIAPSAMPSTSLVANIPMISKATGPVAISEPQPSSSEIIEKIRPYMIDEIKNTLKGTFKDNLRDDIRADVRRMIEKKEASPSQEQAYEFNKKRPCPDSCSDICESDDYIRKDSIPCWSCNLPRN